MSVRLSRLEVLHYRYAIPDPVPTTMGPLRHRPALLLRVEDEEGAEGWGEIWCNFPPDGDLHRARLAVNILGAALAGVDSDTLDPFTLLRTRLNRLALQAGEPGPVSQIAAGADIALNDLRARRAGKPLAEMLGGSAHPVDAYASGISPDKHAAQIERMRGLGYRRFKLRIGFGPDDALPAAQAAFRGMSAGEAMMLDANQAWDLPTAIERCARLAELEPIWMEEPLPADAPEEDWAALAAAVPIPLAAGENMGGRAQFDASIASGALAVLQPDICKWGGISGGIAVARAAEAAGMTYCPHFLGGGVGLIASAHVLCAAGGAGLLEVDSSENPLLEIFSGRGLGLEDGKFPLFQGPGLGFVPDLQSAADMLSTREEIRL